MPGDFGEFTVNIGLGINFLAGGTLFLNSNDTLSYVFRNTVKVLNKDFIKAVWWGGVTVL